MHFFWKKVEKACEFGFRVSNCIFSGKKIFVFLINDFQYKPGENAKKIYRLSTHQNKVSKQKLHQLQLNAPLCWKNMNQPHFVMSRTLEKGA